MWIEPVQGLSSEGHCGVAGAVPPCALLWEPPEPSRARRGCHWIAVQQQHDGQQWPDDGVEVQARTKWAA